MPECPACFGEGVHDMRDSDAYLSEHWSDDEIARAKRAGMTHPVGIVPCEECEGTGVVTEERRRDLVAYAIAAVDQAYAKLREQGLAE